MIKSFLNLFYDFSLKIDDYLTKIFFEIFSSVTHVFPKSALVDCGWFQLGKTDVSEKCAEMGHTLAAFR